MKVHLKENGKITKVEQDTIKTIQLHFYSYFHKATGINHQSDYVFVDEAGSHTQIKTARVHSFRYPISILISLLTTMPHFHIGTPFSK